MIVVFVLISKFKVNNNKNSQQKTIFNNIIKTKSYHKLCVLKNKLFEICATVNKLNTLKLILILLCF